MAKTPDDGLVAVLKRFEASIKGERRAEVVMDGLSTEVRASYFPGHVMDIEGLPELPPVLRFEPEGVKALLQGRLEPLTEEAAKEFNIYRFLDPRTVAAGLSAPYRYNEETYSFEAYFDLSEAQKAQNFRLGEQLIEWLQSYDRLVQPVEFILINDDVRRMTLRELPLVSRKLP